MKRKCSFCLESGHNIRTCVQPKNVVDKVIEISEYIVKLYAEFLTSKNLLPGSLVTTRRRYYVTANTISHVVVQVLNVVNYNCKLSVGAIESQEHLPLHFTFLSIVDNSYEYFDKSYQLVKRDALEANELEEIHKKCANDFAEASYQYGFDFDKIFEIVSIGSGKWELEFQSDIPSIESAVRRCSGEWSQNMNILSWQNYINRLTRTVRELEKKGLDK